MRNKIERLFSDRNGVAAVEFAVVMPILLVLAICTMDLGGGFYRRMQVQNGAQAGATYSTIYGFDAAAIASAITSSTKASVMASPGPRQFCGCPSTTGVSEVTCSSTCSPGITAGTYVTASALAQYTPVFSYPTLPAIMTFQSTALVRIK